MHKVLFVIPHLYGSMRLLVDYTRFLDPAEYQLTFLSLSDDVRLKSELPSAVRLIVAGKPEGQTGWLRVFPRMLTEARRHDLVVGWAELTPTYLAAAAATVARKPVVGWVHTNLSEVLRPGRRPAWAHRPMVRLIYPKLGSVVAVSEDLALDLRRSFRLTNVRAITNGIDIERVRCRGQEPVPKRARHLFEKPALVKVGLLSNPKNHELLLLAHAEVMRQKVDHNLLLVGDGQLEAHLRTMATRLGVTDSVHFLGYLDNPLPVIRASRALVLSSHWEGFAIVLVEALALGTPTVSVDCPSGPREILGDGKFGLLVPPENPHALAEAMKLVLTDSATFDRLHAVGPGGAERYRISDKARQMDALFDSLIERCPDGELVPQRACRSQS
ncbi:MAG: glycosyltransferase [Terriglobia bacterium]